MLHKRVLSVFQTTHTVTLVFDVIYNIFHVVQICTSTNYAQKQITKLLYSVIFKSSWRWKHSEDNSYLEIRLAVCIFLSFFRFINLTNMCNFFFFSIT